MFDVKNSDDIGPGKETERNSQLMEELDVFISVKLKPKQPSKVSKTVIFLVVLLQSLCYREAFVITTINADSVKTVKVCVYFCLSTQATVAFVFCCLYFIGKLLR